MKAQTFAEYLAKGIHSPNKKRFKIFYFHNLISRYAELLGKENIHILFFEDLVNDKKRFSQQLGEILNLQDDMVRAALDKAYLNKTPIEQKGHVVRKIGRLPLGQRIQQVVSNKRMVIPPIKEEERNLIFNSFSSSNLMLADEFDL